MTEPSPKQRFGSSQEALQALEALQSEAEMLASSKPTGSKISLTKSAEKLQILIPPLTVRQQPNRPKFLEKARKSDLIPSFARSLPSPLFILLLVVFGIYYLALALLMLLIPIIGVSILVIAPLILYMLIGMNSSIQLRLIKDKKYDQIHVYFSRRFLRMTLSKSFLLCHRDQVKRQSSVSELIVWFDSQHYAVSSLTPSELGWLSQEISDWLDLLHLPQ